MWPFGRKKKDVLVLGCRGMLGSEVMAKFAELASDPESGIGRVVGLDREDGVRLDSDEVLARDGLRTWLRRNGRFGLCLNCAAFTDTRAAEAGEGRAASWRLNALAPRYVARACAEAGTDLVHVSTDYVFSQFSCGGCLAGRSGFSEYDEPFPCNAYGEHKLAGEQFAREEFRDGRARLVILRTSWLYGAAGAKSFVHRFARNVAKSLKEGMAEVETTSNEVSVPTSTAVVARYMAAVALGRFDDWVPDVVNAVPRWDAPVSRLDFARAVLEGLSKSDARFSEARLVPAERQGLWPTWSPLRYCSPVRMPSWQEDLAWFLKEHGAEIAESAMSG